MKIQLFLILYLLTNDLLFTYEQIATSGNHETVSNFIAEPEAVRPGKHGIARLPTSQRVYGRGITINTAME